MAATVTDHSLARLLHAAARRSFPPSDGTVEVFPALPGPCDIALAFTGYSVVAADVPEDWVREHVPAGWVAEQQHHGTLSVHFLGALADRLGVAPPGINILLAAQKPPQAGPRAGLRPSSRARSDWAAYRSDVVCYEDADGGGVINLGRGPGGRLDLWIELEGADRPWLRASTVVRGKDLLEAARTIAPDDLFASVPSYDGRALRTFLAGGFRAIGAEALFLTRPAD
jgi:hypothetical protein